MWPQSRLALQSVGYELSREETRRREDGLVGQALAAFEQRAGAIARHLGRSSYRMVQLDVGRHQDIPPRPMPRAAGVMMADSARSAPPVVEGGSQTLTVTVTAEIELSPAP